MRVADAEGPLVLSERIKLALALAVDRYASEIDEDDDLRALRLEVRLRPSGDVRAIIVDRQSEIGA